VATFSSQKNLERALLSLQQEDEELVLWIDAMCINQRENDEKSFQVQMIRRIYEAAKLVVVWLGAAGNKSDQAMEKWEAAGAKYTHSWVLKLWDWKFWFAKRYRVDLPSSIEEMVHEKRRIERQSTVETILLDVTIGMRRKLRS
jgi:hypothetical protein